MFDSKEIIGIIRYKVGDMVKEFVHTNGVMLADKQLYQGEVVYVHPCGRFYTVKFNFGDRILKESYTVRSDVNPIMLSGW